MKNILITGATDGIGKLAAAMLAQDGHTVYIHGRNKDKLQATVSEIQSTTQNKNIYGFLSDFSDLDSVKKMAKEAYGQSWSSADKGAHILYELALDNKHKSESGKYFDNDSGFYADAHPDNYDKDAIGELIRLTKKIIN